MIKLTFTGDILVSPEQLEAIRKAEGKYDFRCIFEHVDHRLKEADLVIGNLETPLAGEELEYTHHKWSFNSPEQLALALKGAGFNVLTTANNHCLDRGVKGLVRTIDVLDGQGLEHTGTYKPTSERDCGYMAEVRGVKLAFLSYTYGTNAAFNGHYLYDASYSKTVNLFRPQERKPSRRLLHRAFNKLLRISRLVPLYKWITKDTFSHQKYKRQIKRDVSEALRKGADVVFMCMHSGGQYNARPDMNTRNLMRFLLSCLIDAVIGNHPHVVHPSVKKCGKIGLYSLGDFCPYPGCASAELATPEVFPHYSILAHIYIDEESRKIWKHTFEVLKTAIDIDGVAKVHPLFDLIQQETDEGKRQELVAANLSIHNLVKNLQLSDIPIQREYEL